MVQFPLAARREGASAIHTQYSLSPLVGGLGITTIHDVSFLIQPSWFSLKDRTLLTLGAQSAAKRAKAIIGVSNTDQQEIERYLPATKGKVTVTTNACPPWIVPCERNEAKRLVAEAFGIYEPYLMTLGTRWARKNMDLAVEAVKGLGSDFPHQLAVVGKGHWSLEELGNRGRSLGYVPNQQLGWLYSAADLYLAPSRHEGFGIPVLEAFRCGCPVMCSSGGALPEIAAGAGVVMRSWSPPDWTEAIRTLLTDSSKLQILSEAGYRREREFNWSSTARKTLEIYLDVHSRGSRVA
jgi:glycosyltransferase involved in cell wall biosynthesis